MEYAPPDDYRLDLEVYPVSTLRRRAQLVAGRGVERIDFHCLILVTAGRYRHMVDFESLDCAAGSLLILQPGQVHRFGELVGWKGWLLIFRAELLQPMRTTSALGDLELFQQLAALPTHLRVSGAVGHAVVESFERMASDTKLAGDKAAVNALLRSQADALFVRLYLVGESLARDEQFEPLALRRFQRYRNAVEREHRRWHKVARYANQLGCSTKTLNRSCLAIADASAKSFLTSRIVLEARRLLAHTLSPVSVVSDQLGFDEATNFVKFFRRETQETPGAFRARHSGA